MAKHSLLYGQPLYLFLLILVANAAFEHTWSEICNNCERAKLLMHVASHNKDLPLDHGCANHATEGKCFCPPSAAVT